MEKRVILAFVLSIAVMYLFTSLYAPRKAPESTPEAPSAASGPATPTATTPPASATAPVETSTFSAAAATAQDSRADKAEDFVLDTPLYTATISNVGGVIKSYRLKSYS